MPQTEWENCALTICRGSYKLSRLNNLFSQHNLCGQRKHSIQCHRIVFSTNLPNSLCSVYSGIYPSLCADLAANAEICYDIAFDWFAFWGQPIPIDWLGIVAWRPVKSLNSDVAGIEKFVVLEVVVTSRTKKGERKEMYSRSRHRGDLPSWQALFGTMWKKRGSYSQSKQTYLIPNNFIRYPHRFCTVAKRKVYALINA